MPPKRKGAGDGAPKIPSQQPGGGFEDKEEPKAKKPKLPKASKGAGKDVEIQAVASNPYVRELVPIHPHLPKPPFSLTLIAQKKSGKSTVIANMLQRFYYKAFDQVWILSPTVLLDDTYRQVKMNEERVITDVTRFDGIISDITQEVEKKIDNIKRTVSLRGAMQGWSKDKIKDEIQKQKHEDLDHILIVVDDAVGIKAMNKGSKFTTLFSRHRHYMISLIVSVQDYKAVPPVVRCNSNAMIFFRIYNKKQLQKIVEEQTSIVTDKTWMAIYDHATIEPYNFLYINYNHHLYTYFKNFTTPLVVDRE